jgi:tripartite-type tricarboxylate transporter receptor subunit TctC
MLAREKGMKRACPAWILGAALLLAASITLAQPYPARPIRIVVPFPPGGASDVTARILSEKFMATWGASVVVDNRTGATGIIGTDIVAKASPDGHTLAMVALSFAINPSIHKLPYDAQKDFTYITVTSSNALMLVVNNNVPAKTVKELIGLAQAKPGDLKFASSGTGSSPHMTAELFKLMTGAKIAHIPYKGSTAAHPDLLGGRVDMMFDPIAAIAPHVRAGRLRPLGVTGAKRSAEFPDVPAIAETVPGYESTSWVLLLGPAKLPAAIVDRLHQETLRALALPDVKERLARMGSDIVGSRPEEARKFIRAELEKWAKTVKAAGITSGQ